MHVKMELKHSEHRLEFRRDKTATTRKNYVFAAQPRSAKTCAENGEMRKRNYFNHRQSKLIPLCRLRLWLLRLSLSNFDINFDVYGTQRMKLLVGTE